MLARAKINLTLHVGSIILDPHDPFYGYHPLDSLVIFADFGDRLTLTDSDVNGLEISGPFAKALTTNSDNLVMRALAAAKREKAHVQLEKNLPVSAGLGGGSANAAAVLRLCGIEDVKLAIDLGADVPVCLQSQTSRMTGIGENISPLPGLGQLQAVLINPGVAVSTGEIFKAFDAASPQLTPRPQKSDGDLLARALDGRNDLQTIAMTKAPVIATVLRELSSQPGCQLARMSGSGATCFGIFDSATRMKRAVAAISDQNPDWWVQPVRLGDA